MGANLYNTIGIYSLDIPTGKTTDDRRIDNKAPS